MSPTFVAASGLALPGVGLLFLCLWVTPKLPLYYYRGPLFYFTHVRPDAIQGW